MKKSIYSDPGNGTVHKTAKPHGPVGMAETFDPAADVERRLSGLENLLRREEQLTGDQIASLAGLMLEPNEDETLRMMAIQILGKSKDGRAFKPLQDFYYQFPQFPARHIVIQALGDLGLPEARPTLVEALAKEAKIGDRTHAAAALEHPGITPDERQALKTAVLGDSSELVQLAALRTLARTKQDREFLQAVTEMTTLPNTLRILAQNGWNKDVPVV